jgi:hypothetical protein
MSYRHESRPLTKVAWSTGLPAVAQSGLAEAVLACVLLRRLPRSVHMRRPPFPAPSLAPPMARQNLVVSTGPICLGTQLRDAEEGKDKASILAKWVSERGRHWLASCRMKGAGGERGERRK